jgi:threonine/homoserine/homoserine lactone efflux protein
MVPVSFILAVSVLMLIPGPNVALITANSVAHGVRFGLLTVAATTAAMAVQLGFTALGLTAFLGAAGTVFFWLRWLGAGYLVYLGVSHWRAAPADLTAIRAAPKSAAILRRGLLVSLTNPKTLLFYSALFPQFIVPGQPLGRQLAVLSLTFLFIAAVIDSFWAILAHQARRLLARQGRFRNRLTGGLLIGAGLGLAAARHR